MQLQQPRSPQRPLPNAAILQSMSWTLFEEVMFDAGGIGSVDWATYPILRFDNAPGSVEVHIIDRPGLPFLGAAFKVMHDPDMKNQWGSVQAIDLSTGKQAWTFPSELPWNSGMLSTAGGLVFSGSADGYLYAFDAKSGKVLVSAMRRTSHRISRRSLFSD